MSRLQHVARLLGVARVETLCKKFVRRGLTVENCLGRYSLADSFLGWQDTAALIETFIQINFSQILSQQRHQFCEKISEVELTRILSSPDLQTVSEDEVLEAALSWVEADLASKARAAEKMRQDLRSAQLAGDGDLAAKLRRDEARLCLNISKMEERLQRLAPDPGLVEEVERLAVERTVREADVILSCLSSPLERYLHPASVCRSV